MGPGHRPNLCDPLPSAHKSLAINAPRGCAASSLSILSRRSLPQLAVAVRRPRRPSSSPVATRTGRPRRRSPSSLVGIGGSWNRVISCCNWCPGELPSWMASMVTASCEDGGARAADMAEALQNLPHALMLQPFNQNASNQDEKSFNQIHQKLQAVIAMAECYNHRHKMLQPLMKKLQPETIEKALTKAATKKKAATIDRKASTVDEKSYNH